MIRRQRPGPAERPDRAFMFLLLFSGVLFLRPQDIFAPLGALHLAELSALAGLAALFYDRITKGLTLTRMTPEFVGVIAFGLVILLTVPFSLWPGGSLGVFTDLYSKVILVYLLAVNVVSSPRRLERLTAVLVLTVGYIGFRAVLDYARGVNMVAGGRVHGAVGGVLGNPNDLALNMVVFLPLAIFLAARKGSIVMRLAALACAAFMLGAIVASGSRGGSLGFVAMALVLAFFLVRQRPALVAAAAFAAVLALPLVPSSYWNRLASITDSSKDETGSRESRRVLLGESMQAYAQNPIIGVGAGEFKDWNNGNRKEGWHEAHNVFLQVGAELGTIGLVAFLFVLFRAFLSVVQTRRLMRRMPRSPDRDLFDAHSAATAAALVGWLVCALFGSVAYNWTFYFLLALAATPREILRAWPQTPAAAERLQVAA